MRGVLMRQAQRAGSTDATGLCRVVTSGLLNCSSSPRTSGLLMSSNKGLSNVNINSISVCKWLLSYSMCLVNVNQSGIVM